MTSTRSKWALTWIQVIRGLSALCEGDHWPPLRDVNSTAGSLLITWQWRTNRTRWAVDIVWIKPLTEPCRPDVPLTFTHRGDCEFPAERAKTFPALSSRVQFMCQSWSFSYVFWLLGAARRNRRIYLFLTLRLSSSPEQKVSQSPTVWAGRSTSHRSSIHFL